MKKKSILGHKMAVNIIQMTSIVTSSARIGNNSFEKIIPKICISNIPFNNNAQNLINKIF